MPLPNENTFTLLSDAANTLRDVFHDNFPTIYQRFGRTTNRLIRLSKRRINGDGITVQFRHGNMHAARIDRDINAAFGQSSSPTFGEFKAVFSENAATNHFRRMSIRLSTTWWDMIRTADNGRSAAIDWMTELVEQAAGNVSERLAHTRNLPASGAIASISTTPKRNNASTYAGAGSITTTDGARVQITGGSIAYFQRGMFLDRYTGATKDGTVFVTDYNPSDNSVGLYGLDANGQPSASVNINDIAAGDVFYHRDGKDNNALTIEEWFTAPSAGEFFFLDRTTVDGRALLPTTLRPNASTTTVLSLKHLDDLDQTLQHVTEGGLKSSGYVCHAPPGLERRLRNEVGADALITIGAEGDDTGRRLAKAGFDGISFRSPGLGRVVLDPDPLAKLERITFKRIGDWEMLHPGTPGIQWLPGEMKGDWYRPEVGSPGQGKGTFIQKDGAMAFCDVCVGPARLQAALTHVTES